MLPAAVYHPFWFYFITISLAVLTAPLANYLSNHKGYEQFQLPLLLLGLSIPCITAIAMIYGSHEGILVGDFWKRMLLFKITPGYLAIILLLMPCVICLATGISLFFGYSADQFLVTKEFSVMKGWAILGIAIPLILAPIIEEVGWRGYGVDSLSAYFNVFTASVLFGLLWALWHLPAFFIKGYYHNQLWQLGFIYVVNFFVSVFVIAILMNWVYFKTGRSIPAVVLLHSMLNLSSMVLRTEQFTKCVATVLLCIITVIVIVYERDFFFSSYSGLQYEADRLRKVYGFPGATVAYVLPDGTVGEVATGFSDVETKRPMTPQSRMLAASIGKTFVAATVINLAKEGRLGLDDPLSDWLGGEGWYSHLPNHDTITIRHLLTHSAGVPDHVYSSSFLKSKDFGKGDFSPESLIRHILDEPPLFEAGKGWAYTDTGYVLLGLVIERATGNSCFDEVQERFLKPLKLDNTAPSDQKILPGLVSGYTGRDNMFGLPVKTVDESGVMVWDPKIEWAGGGLITTSHDLAVWAKYLYEGHAMRGEYLGELLQSVPIGERDEVRYGAGVLINRKSPFGDQLGHGGIIPGYCSSMRYYPKYGIAVAFQINTDDRVKEYVAEMERCLLEKIIKEV